MNKMSTRKTIAVYSNLPTGGARATYASTIKFLSRHYNIKFVKEPTYHVHNFLYYLWIALIRSPHEQRMAIQNLQYDLLMVYHSWLVKSPAILRYSRTNTLYICHETLREYYDTSHINTHTLKEKITNLIRLPIKWADKYNAQAKSMTVVVNSQLSKNIVDRAYGVNSTIIYPGVDTKAFANRNFSAAKINQVICVGAINKYKRQDFLVDVVGQISLEIRPSLLLVGNGFNKEYLRFMKNKAKKLGVNLLIKINISDQEKIRELKKSKIFLFAPVSEPYGLVVNEAMAAGLPLVIYGLGGGFTEVISKNNGIIINNLDTRFWARKVTRLIQDDRLMSQYSKYNLDYSGRMDSIYMNQRILKVIRKLL